MAPSLHQARKLQAAVAASGHLSQTHQIHCRFNAAACSNNYCTVLHCKPPVTDCTNLYLSSNILHLPTPPQQPNHMPHATSINIAGWHCKARPGRPAAVQLLQATVCKYFQSPAHASLHTHVVASAIQKNTQLLPSRTAGSCGARHVQVLQIFCKCECCKGMQMIHNKFCMQLLHINANCDVATAIARSVMQLPRSNASTDVASHVQLPQKTM
jgi:hypothetical protein